MRSENEIKEKIKELECDLKNIMKEKTNQNQLICDFDECIEIIKIEIKTLKWVLGEIE